MKDMLPQLFFLYFATAITALSLLTVFGRNLVHAVLWMLLLFFHIGGLYLFLNAEFMAAIQIIVYAGAILVLFLFVILLLNLREEYGARALIRSWQGRGFLCGAFVLGAVLTLHTIVLAPQGKYSIEYIRRETHTKTLGTVLFNEYAFPFVIVALILCVPMIAVVVLAIRRKER